MQADVTAAQEARIFRDGLGPSWVNDQDKPYYHVMPRDGWINGDASLLSSPSLDDPGSRSVSYTGERTQALVYVH